MLPLLESSRLIRMIHEKRNNSHHRDVIGAIEKTFTLISSYF